MKKGTIILSVFLAQGAIVYAQDLFLTHPISDRVGCHENQDWLEFRGFHYTDDKKDLPRVLLIGDSISAGYRKHVQERLDGIANVTWLTMCYCVTTPNFMQQLAFSLDDAGYDVIHFNNGGHSLRSDLGAYEKCLSAALKLIREKQPQARIVWARTTPVRDAVRNAGIDKLNAVADRVVAAANVEGVDDLHAAMLEIPSESRWADGCHPTKPTLARLVSHVTKSVYGQLSVMSGVAPSKCHREHLEDGIMAIVHFGLNTFADKEWGYGDTLPSDFNPTRLDTDQWVEAMMAGGIRRVVMVTKHHDGFNLWPSPYNADYTVANSPWRDGKGDVVALIRKSCLDRGLRFGTYLSPWDRHQASYAKPEYVTYYRRQFDELFEKYGPLSEIWLDGANGGDGYYGGARERRKLPVEAWDYYRIPDVLDRMLARYPDAIAFGGRGRSSARWVGNEAGYAPAIVEYVTDRGFWETPECDTPLRKGWFWHPNEAPKALSHLVDIYFNSVGRGCVLNLGIAPNREGLVGEDDVRRLKEFGDYVRAFNAVDFAKDATVYRFPGIYQIDLSAETEVNAVDVMENLEFGQKIRSWKFEVEKDGRWQPVLESATVGYRRIERFDAVKARKFRVVVTESGKGAYLDRVALRFARTVPKEPNAEILRRYFANAGVEVITAQGERACDFIAEWRFPGKVRGFKFDPRHNLGNLPDRWELRLSEDGKNWGAVVQEGEFGNILANPVEQFVEFPKELKVRYAKLTAVHAAKGEASFNPAHKHCIIFF